MSETLSIKRGDTVRVPYPHSTPGHEPNQFTTQVLKAYPDGSIIVKGSPSIWPPSRYLKL